MDAEQTLLNEMYSKIELQKRLPETTKIKLYKRRWVVLVIFVLYATISGAHWVEYSIIADIAAKYYNVSTMAIDWTSISYMAVYPILAIPASYIIDEMGLRAAGLIGCLGTAFGSFLKIFSVEPHLFWLAMLAQTILAIVQVLIYSLPPRLAAVWFEAREVSTACSLGVFGFQLGIAWSFVLTPMVVKNHEDFNLIGDNLRLLSYIFAACMVPLSVAVLIYFPKEPPIPPSVTQAKERNSKTKFSLRKMLKSMRVLLKDPAFMVLNAAYSINIGVFCALSAFINQVVLPYFPNAHEDVGRMGLGMIILGMFGCLSFGLYLDRSHKYK